MEIHIPFNGCTLVVSDDDPIAAFAAAQPLFDIPKRCVVRGCNAQTRLRYRKVEAQSGEKAGEELEFVDVECLNYPVRHRSTLGKHKAKTGGGLYYRSNLEKNPWNEYNFESLQAREVPPEEHTTYRKRRG